MLDIFYTGKLNSQKTEHDLIRVCDGLENANRQLHDIFAAEDADRSGTVLAHNQATWEALASHAAQIPAETLAGVRARVRALGCDFVAEVIRSAELTDPAERSMLEALIRDLTGTD